MLSTLWLLMKLCGEPVSKRATQSTYEVPESLCALISVVNEVVLHRHPQHQLHNNTTRSIRPPYIVFSNWGECWTKAQS